MKNTETFKNSCLTKVSNSCLSYCNAKLSLIICTICWENEQSKIFIVLYTCVFLISVCSNGLLSSAYEQMYMSTTMGQRLVCLWSKQFRRVEMPNDRGGHCHRVVVKYRPHHVSVSRGGAMVGFGAFVIFLMIIMTKMTFGFICIHNTHTLGGLVGKEGPKIKKKKSKNTN